MARSPVSLPAPAAPASLAGIALMIGAMAIAPGLDTMAKVLMERLSPLEVGFGRFLAQTLVLLPLVLWMGPGRPGRLHVAAGVCLALTLLSLNLGLREMPVANTLAIFFVEPLILTLLGALLLGERLGRRRLQAVALGLVGALIVLRPNFAVYGAAALWPLAAALFFALYMLATRALSRRPGGAGTRLALQFWTGVVAMVFLGAALGLGVKSGLGPVPLWPTPREVALFAAIGVLAGLAHQMIVHALARIETGVAAPLQYLEIVSASLLGWWVFGDFPDALTWVGTGVIVVAGLAVVRGERAPARTAATPASAPFAIPERRD